MDDFNNINNENNGINGGVNLNKSPEPQNDSQANDGGVNLFKSPEVNNSSRQGESNAQQGMNFSGQTNFGGQPNPNPAPNQFNQPPVQPNQFGGQNMNNMGGFNPNPSQNFNQNGGGQGLAIASMVCGIVSILGFCCCTPIGILCGLAGIVCGIISKMNNMQGAGMALAGIITGAVGLVGTIIWLIIGQAFRDDFIAELEQAMESAIHFMF